MGPRKRPETGTLPPVKRNKQNTEISQNLPDNSDSKSILESGTDDNENLYLLLLPNEVLLSIYNLLSPLDLLSLTKLNNERLTDLTYTIREANVSSCRKDSPLSISNFFTKTRVKYIHKLNFNYCFYMTPFEIVNIVRRCKHLKSLSVVGCGLRYENVINILANSKRLEELAWNAEEVLSQFSPRFPNIRRLHLFCNIQKVTLFTIAFARNAFPNFEHIWIHFAPDSVSVLPLTGLWLWSSCVTYGRLSRQCLLTINNLQFNHVTDISTLTSFMKRPLKDNEDNPDSNVHRVYNNPPYLQIRSVMEDISQMSDGPFRSYSTVAILIKSEILNVSDSLVNCVKEVAGKKLKHLSIQSEAELSSNGTPLPISNEEAVVVCDVLSKMFLSSKNITVLNLTSVHFSAGSPMKAISQLICLQLLGNLHAENYKDLVEELASAYEKNLKVLNIPSCAFGDSSKVTDSQSFELSSIVLSCRKVEEFALNCCVQDSCELTEADLVCIKDWLLLKKLSILSLVFRSCNFLKKVADSCVLLQSLSLISVAPRKICLFTNDVIYLLKKAKNLRFLRINEEKFNPMFERFWPAIGECVNLEGICIATQSKAHINRQTVIKAIKKLKYLHLLHFSAPLIPDRLYSEAKRSMIEHGMKNVEIKKECNIDVFTLPSPVKFYHEPPHFWCQDLHLKELEIF